MSCPQCAGSERKRVAPGYFECTTELVEFWNLPDGTPRPVYFVCTHRYQAPDALLAGRGLGECRCGTLALRRCQRCSTVMCGDHSYSVPEWVCGTCRDLQRKELTAAEARTAKEKQREYRALPEGRREHLVSLITDLRSPVKDGRTHQFWDWTNEDVAKVLVDLLGPYDYMLNPKQTSIVQDVLTPDGTCVRKKFSNGVEGAYRTPQFPVEIEKTFTGPRHRFNGPGAWEKRSRDPESVYTQAYENLQTMYHSNRTDVERRIAHQRDESARERQVRVRSMRYFVFCIIIGVAVIMAVMLATS